MRFILFSPFLPARSRFAGAVIWLSVLLVLSGCSTKGDFGRPRQLKLLEFTTDFVTEVFIPYDVSQINGIEGNYAGVPFGLTKPEIFVRDSAVHFSQSLSKKHQGPGEQLKPTAYAEDMTQSGLTHGATRIGVLHAQIKSDLIWLKRFIRAARRVKVDDGERAFYLATRKMGITNQDRIRTYSRIKENEQIIFGTFSSIEERIASYVYVIERTPMETPGVATGKAQAALETLRNEAAKARVKYDKIVRRRARRHAIAPGSWRPILTRSLSRKNKRKSRKGYRKKWKSGGKYSSPKVTKMSGKSAGWKRIKPVARKSGKSSNGYGIVNKDGKPMDIAPPKQ